MATRLREWICRTGGRIQELPLAASVRTATPSRPASTAAANSYPSTALLQQARGGCLLWGLTLSG